MLSFIRSRGNRCAGFTLIELLVVISIIMVLAGMLFPTFTRARQSAITVDCISNLRQCGYALQMYRDDWDGRFPAQDLASSRRIKSGITAEK